MSFKKSPQQKRSPVFFLKLSLVVVLLIFATVFLLSLLKPKMIKQFIASMGEPAFAVTAMTLTPQPWTPALNTTGLVRANQGAMLSAQIPGVVAEILVKAGQPVKKGDVLVKLDSQVEMANLQATEVQLSSAKNTYQRYAALRKSQSVSQQEFDNAKAAYDALVANVEALKSAIARRQIVAPFDGVAGIVKVNEGQFVGAGTEMLRLEDRTKMKIDFAVSQRDLSKIVLGQRVTATIDALADKPFYATITAIEPAVNTTTGLVDVQATFDPQSTEESSPLLAGMFARLSIALPTQVEQIVVPQVAINYNMYGEIAYLLVPLSDEEKQFFANRPDANSLYRVKQIMVNTQDRQGIYAQLTPESAHFGSRIITSGQQNLQNGSLVKVVDKTAVGTVEPKKKTNL